MADTVDSNAAGSNGSKRRMIPVLVIGGLGLIYGGYRFYLAHQPYEWSGTVEARMISVGSRAGGRVKEVLAHEGEEVKAGQPLLILETGDLAAQLLAAQGQLGQAQATLEKLEKGARPEELAEARARAATASAAWEQTRTGARSEQIAAARARLAAQEVLAQKAQLDEQRYRLLFQKGAAARAELDNAETNLRAQVATRDALKQQMEELEHGSRSTELEQAKARAQEARASEQLVKAGSRVEDIKAAHGQVDAAQGRVDQIKVLIDELTVKAPRAARIESLDLRPGDIIAPNATAATLLEEDQLYVRIYVPETLIGKVKIGQEVPVTVDSFPGKRFKGVVEHINTVGEYSPRNLQTADERADQVFGIRVGLKEGRDVLRAGMAAFIQVSK